MSSVEQPVGESVRGSFWNRIARALRLDPSVFDAVEADPHSILQALPIVLLAGIARGVFDLPTEAGPGVVASTASAIVLWLLATGLLTSVGVNWLHGTSDFREMLRVLGFAAAPLWLLAPAFFLEGRAHDAAGLLVHAWAIAAAVVAVRQALDVSTGRALGVCGLSFALAVGLLLLLGAPMGHCA